jgi:hypothetical protein
MASKTAKMKSIMTKEAKSMRNISAESERKALAYRRNKQRRNSWLKMAYSEERRRRGDNQNEAKAVKYQSIENNTWRQSGGAAKTWRQTVSGRQLAISHESGIENGGVKAWRSGKNRAWRGGNEISAAKTQQAAKKRRESSISASWHGGGDKAGGGRAESRLWQAALASRLATSAIRENEIEKQQKAYMWACEIARSM